MPADFDAESEEIIRRPTLIVLGLGEAGQKIMLSLEKLAYDLKIGDVVDEWVTGSNKVLIRTFMRKDGEIGVKFVKPLDVAVPPIQAQEEKPPNAEVTENVALSSQLRALRGRMSRATRLQLQECSDFTATDIGEVLERLRTCSPPILSYFYGFSMVRIDLDEGTLIEAVSRDRMRNILRQTQEQDQTQSGLTAFIPPGFSILNAEKMKVHDEYLNEDFELTHTSGAQGRSSTVYYYIKNSESSPLFNILGIEGATPSMLIRENVYRILTYRAILLIHGLVGSGAGIASAILDQLRDLATKADIGLDSKLLMNLVVVPSAEERARGKLPDPKTWEKIVKWDVNKIVSFITEEPEVLDASFVVDLDFALLQDRRHELINEKGILTGNEFTEFIKELLKGNIQLYNKKEFENVDPNLRVRDLAVAYDRLDDLISYSLEPVMSILGPRGVRFGSGGSSVDLSELKGMISGYAVVPMVSTMEVFEKYVEYSAKIISNSPDVDVGEEAVAALLVPAIHGLFAPVQKNTTERVIVVVNRKALDEIDSKLDFTITSYDIINALKEVFTDKTDVRVWVSSTAKRTSVVMYALADPETYFENIISKKGWE